MVAAKLRADAAPGHAAQAGAALARRAPAVKPGRGAGRPRKQVELLKRENRSLKQVVCRLRGLDRRLRAELQAKMRAKTSELKTLKREHAARRTTERGVVCLAGEYYKCAVLWNIGHAGADAVVAHLDAGIARQTLQMGAAVGSRCLGPCPLSFTINTPTCTQLGQRRSASRVGQVGCGKCMPCEATPPTGTSCKDRKLTCAR